MHRKSDRLIIGQLDNLWLATRRELMNHFTKKRVFTGIFRQKSHAKQNFSSDGVDFGVIIAKKVSWSGWGSQTTSRRTACWS
jgi:hypothetical protein